MTACGLARPFRRRGIRSLAALHRELGVAATLMLSCRAGASVFASAEDFSEELADFDLGDGGFTGLRARPHPMRSGASSALVGRVPIVPVAPIRTVSRSTKRPCWRRTRRPRGTLGSVPSIDPQAVRLRQLGFNVIFLVSV